MGGIHGSGKGTVCKDISKRTNLINIVASELIKWNDISTQNNKKVNNINETQERLHNGISKIVNSNKAYLLDGHFCLFNDRGEISKIPQSTFERINPKLIAIVTEEIKIIQERLEKRDNRAYDFELLSKMQKVEISYSKEIAKILNIKHLEIKNGNYNLLLENL